MKAKMYKFRNQLFSKSSYLLILMLLNTSVYAQTPQKMTYQAVIRDGGNQLMVSQTIGMKISILQGTSNGTLVYEETHFPLTNSNGLISIEIGGGSGFDTIHWSDGPYFLKTQIDPIGGTTYSIENTSQLLSVPYAFYADSCGTPGPEGPVGPQGPIGLQGQAGTSSCGTINSGDGRIVIYSSTNAWGYGFNEVSGSNFYSISISGTLLGAIASDSNIVVYTTTNAYGFGKNNVSGSGWYTRTLSSPPEGYIVSSGRIVLYNANEAYGFGKNNTSGSAWYLRSLSGLPTGSFSAGNRIVLYNSTDAYGFGYNEVSGSDWKTQAISLPIDITGTR